ncbi:MAG: Fpg/Nei family DNA glycosylase [Promethearchaeota archaeon]
MPELPEVETFKQYLEKTSLKQVIKTIQIVDSRVLNIDNKEIIYSLKDKRFESAFRHGKYLFVYIKPKYLIMHFGMTGDLEYYDNKEDDPLYSKVIFHFVNGFNLAYISRRIFGRLDLIDSIEEFIQEKKLGPDALKMSFEDFEEAVKRRSAIIKNALLNQSFIAGIGNIYSDEILFKSKINPYTKIDSLNESKLKELFANIKKVLNFGIKKQGDLTTYPNDFLIPHRKKEERCPICDYEIERYDISGRRGFFCPHCQA